MINVVLSNLGGGWELAKSGGGQYESVSLGLRDGSVPTGQKKHEDNTEAVIRESRASCALHLACRKSACTGLSAL